ncbi:MAG: aldolase/citrate lyase family protein [Pollutimonas bauzanensis]
MTIPIRSFLFVPGDSQRKLAKADDTSADALILDLEDSVSASNAPLARRMVREYLDSRQPGARTKQVWVRCNPVHDAGALADLQKRSS